MQAYHVELRSKTAEVKFGCFTFLSKRSWLISCKPQFSGLENGDANVSSLTGERVI